MSLRGKIPANNGVAPALVAVCGRAVNNLWRPRAALELML